MVALLRCKVFRRYIWFLCISIILQAATKCSKYTVYTISLLFKNNHYVKPQSLLWEMIHQQLLEQPVVSPISRSVNCISLIRGISIIIIGFKHIISLPPKNICNTFLGHDYEMSLVQMSQKSSYFLIILSTLLDYGSLHNTQ